MTDLKLENDKVVVEGRLKIEGPELIVEGNDIKLDKADRRSNSNASRHRRALVHGHEDELILNYGDDYLGVTINGNRGKGVEINGNVFVSKHFGMPDDSNMYIGGTAKFRKSPVVPDLLITELGTKVTPNLGGGGRFGNIPLGSIPKPASLVDIIKDLRKKIGKLENRLSALES